MVPSAGGVVLVCQNCGHENPLEVPPTAPEGGAAKAPPQAERPAAVRPAPGPADSSHEGNWLSKSAMEKLIPQPGPGLRCRKCAQLLGEHDNCPRCGLNAVEGARFADGEAPWEVAPPGQEAAFDQATLLWKVVDESPTDDNLEKFYRFVREEDLLEYGIRRFRFFLVDHPDDERARANLEQLAQSFQAKMIVARAQAEVRAGNIAATTARLKTILLGAVFFIWFGIFLVFLSQVVGPNC